MEKIINVKKDSNIILSDEEIQESIYKAEEDYKAGRILNAEDLFKQWDRKYGVQN